MTKCATAQAHPKALPIDGWARVMALQLTEEEAGNSLRDIYRHHRPETGELIFTGACEFTCQHCIYAPSFARFNRRMDLADWKRVVAKAVGELGIGTFVYGGRSVTGQGVELLYWIRRNYPSVRLGMIDNGISMVPYREELQKLELDWIDISFDGAEPEHDRQRGRVGSFRHGLDGAIWLKEQHISPKVSISTFLTSMNRGSVVEMIISLNREGFKNFFVIPVVLAREVRPDRNLMPTAHELRSFVTDLHDAAAELEDTYIEVNLFMAEYFSAVLQHVPSMRVGMRGKGSYLGHEIEAGNNVLSLNYYPLSLSGVRELILNTDGGVILPEAMADGYIPQSKVVGNAVTDGLARILDGLADSAPFAWYINQLSHERRLLKEFYHGLGK
jgi:MoaA/NifB/PqqE/SkfB family radical SAM enzyme